MKLCAAQAKPVTGDIPANITRHKPLIALAAGERADLILFPELSLTGYEPALARKLAVDASDARFDAFQALSDAHRIVIGAGAPTKCDGGICISLLLFQPRKPRRFYSKSYLHPDEDPFFVPGRSSPGFNVRRTRLALAICFEISVPEHLRRALKSRPQIYLASVAKIGRNIGKAGETLAGIAREHSLTALMSNCVGLCDGEQGAGRTSVWNERGSLLGQLNDADEGLLIFDTETQEVTERLP